jgi:tetratricopeptide (TPR) repeat protein
MTSESPPPIARTEVQYSDDAAADPVTEANELRRRFEMPEAEAIAAQATKEYPASAAAHLALGRILLATRRLDAALTEFTKASNLAPGDEQAPAWRIAALSRQRKYDEAVALGHAACADAYPESVLVHIALGRVYLDSSRPIEAIHWLSRATELEPDDMKAIRWHADCLSRLGQWSEGKKLTGEAIERNPASARAYLIRGLMMSDHGRDDLALVALDRAYALDPTDPSVLEWRITILRYMQRYNVALKAAAEAVDRYPRAPHLHIEYAWVFSNQGDYEEALTHVDRALAIDPGNEWGLESKVDFQRYLGKYHEAARAAASALGLRSDCPDLHLAAARSTHDHDLALRHVKDALALDPRDAAALRYQIQRLGSARRFPDAEKAAQEAVGYHPYDPRFALALAELYAGQEQDDKCELALAQALRIDPVNADAMLMRGSLLLRSGHAAAAGAASREFLAAFPDDPARCMQVAEAYANDDQYITAAEYADEALRIDPRNMEALRRRVTLLASAHRFDDAERAALRAVAERGGDSGLLIVLSQYYFDRGRYDSALMVVSRVPVTSSRSAQAQVLKADILSGLGRRNEAVRVLREGLGKHADPPTYIRLSDLYVARGKYRRALKILDQAVHKSPDRDELFLAQAKVLLKMKRYSDATEAFTNHLEYWPGDAYKCLDVAGEYSIQRRYDDAATYTQRALQIDPQYQAAMQNLVYYLVWSDRTNEARQAALRVVTEFPDDPWSHLALSFFRESEQDYEAALRHVQEALDLDADLEEALVRRFDLLLIMYRRSEAQQYAEQAPKNDCFQRFCQLLVRFAEIAEQGEQMDIALSCRRRAVDLNLQDTNAIVAYGRLLIRLRQYRQARWWLEGIRRATIAATETARLPLLPVADKSGETADALSELYQEMGCRAKERVRAHGNRWKQLRNRAWWLTGGPFDRIRRRMVNVDDRILGRWEAWSAKTNMIETLPGLEGFKADAARAECDAYILSWARKTIRAERFRDSVRWITGILALAGVWSVLYFLVFSIHPSLSKPDCAGLATLTAAAGGGIFWISDLFVWAGLSRLRIVARCILTLAVLVAAALLIYRVNYFSVHTAISSATSLTRLMISLALIAAATLTAAIEFPNGLAVLISEFRIGVFRRRNPRAAILDHLFALIGDMRNVSLRNDLSARSRWIRTLEQVSQRLERDLPRYYGTMDPQTADWMNQRAAGAGRWVRRLQRHVMLPTEGSWDRLSSSLQDMAATVAIGDFAGLRWAEPPRVAAKRKRIWMLQKIVQTLTVMFLPLLALAVIGLLTPLTGGLYRSGTLLCIGWAILYLLLSIDPTLREKIGTARDLIGTVRDSTKPQSPMSSGSPERQAEAPPREPSTSPRAPQ